MDDPRATVARRWMPNLDGHSINSFFEALNAADPLRQPVADNAVEAGRLAYADWCRAHDKRDPWPYTQGIKAAIRAADRARGRSYIEWHAPEEFKPSPLMGRVILVIVDGGRGHEDYRDFRTHWSPVPLGDTVIAWAEKPEPPAWAQVARTAPPHPQGKLADGPTLPAEPRWTGEPIAERDPNPWNCSDETVERLVKTLQLADRLCKDACEISNQGEPTESYISPGGHTIVPMETAPTWAFRELSKSANSYYEARHPDEVGAPSLAQSEVNVAPHWTKEKEAAYELAINGVIRLLRDAGKQLDAEDLNKAAWEALGEPSINRAAFPETNDDR